MFIHVNSYPRLFYATIFILSLTETIFKVKAFSCMGFQGCIFMKWISSVKPCKAVILFLLQSQFYSDFIEEFLIAEVFWVPDDKKLTCIRIDDLPQNCGISSASAQSIYHSLALKSSLPHILDPDTWKALTFQYFVLAYLDGNNKPGTWRNN